MASMAWVFDCLDQQIFILARKGAMDSLLHSGQDANLYGGYATAIFIAGWATGGLIFGAVGDRIGRARTLMITVLMYSVFTGLSALSKSCSISRSIALSPAWGSAASDRPGRGAHCRFAPRCLARGGARYVSSPVDGGQYYRRPGQYVVWQPGDIQCGFEGKCLEMDVHHRRSACLHLGDRPVPA
ncbi:MAG: MFS transporter [Chthoniobacter sp.]